MSYLERVRGYQAECERSERSEKRVTAQQIVSSSDCELSELSELSLRTLYDRLRAISVDAGFDSPVMRAERSRINQEIHRRKYAVAVEMEVMS